jgi:hypothetical protein
MLRYFYITTLCLVTVCPIAVFAQDSTYRGKEFWVGYGHHQFMEPGQSNSQAFVLYLSTLSQPAVVTISINGTTPLWSRTYNIPANSVVVSDQIPKSGSSDARLYSIPIAFGGTGSVGMFSRGIHIQSDVPIAAYSHIYGSASSGASLLLPVNTWGYSYQSVNSKQKYASNCFSWTYVIAKEDSTMVEIRPSMPTRASSLTGLQQGVPTIVTLQKGQIYVVGGDNFGNDEGYELTGTSIRSLSAGKPIAVFAGSSRTSNPAACGSGGGDNDMVQLFPLHIWGKRYLTAPLPSSSNASSTMTTVYKILVNDPQTVVTRNGVLLTGLVNNTYQYESNTADYIVADQPIMLAQFMIGGSCLSGGLGDPDMYYLSPMEASVNRVNCVRSNRENISVNYALITLPTAGIASLLIDGSAAFDHSYTHPRLSGYSVVVKKWSAAIGQFTIQSDSAFTGIGFGVGPVESYGYNLGAHFKPNNGVDSLMPMAWSGAASADWFNPANWNTAAVPTNIDHVTIPVGTPFSPTIPAGLVATCKSIVVQNGVEVNVGANATLKVLARNAPQ